MDNIKKIILEASFKTGACHIGSALSCAEIIDAIYRVKKEKDIFIFSKASGVAALYAVLADRKIISKKKVAHYLKHYPLVSKEVPGVIFSGGSLGHGLPVACGLALADRKRRVYVLIGDAEVQEGTTWESILFARHHNLKNLEIIVDKNGLQACGATRDILGIGEALNSLQKLFPIEVIRTTKGDGVDFMEENGVDWHYKNLDKDLLKKALRQI